MSIEVLNSLSFVSSRGKENLEILAEFQESKSAKKPGREKFGEMMSRIESMDGEGILAWHQIV